MWFYSVRGDLYGLLLIVPMSSCRKTLLTRHQAPVAIKDAELMEEPPVLRENAAS
jgi:hypothetical protein